MADKKNGFHFPYMIKETSDKGLGVFAGKAIGQGSIVWRHVPGQYLVYDEQTFKALIAKMSRAEVVYQLTHVFGLKDFPGVLIRILDDGVLINHSSNANLATNNTVAAHKSSDVTSPRYLRNVAEALLDERYAVVATRDIEKGEEFTMDYVADVLEPPYYDVLFEQYGVDEDYLNDP
jgi:hypothetical protein